jgi:RNA polymerase sigma-70 factor (ECF subfamily)
MGELSSQAETLQLIHRCREGDTVAVESLIHAYKTVVYRLALSILDDAPEADEAAQDALLTAIRKLDSYRGEAAFSTWLYTITLNVCRMRLRKRKSRERWQGVLQSLFLRPTEAVREPEQNALTSENDRVVWQAIQQLTPDQREVVVLRYMQELPIKEIAQVAGVSERTVQNRLHAAQAKLQALLVGKVDWS